MASIKFVAVSRGLKDILDYITNREKTTDSLITGVNCIAQTTQDEFEAVKKQFRKTDGRSYYHIVQAFSPEDNLSFEMAHEIGLQFAAFFPGYQCVVATHMNTKHKHNHIVMNSVNCETDMKFHQSANEMRQAKEFSNGLCRRYGLTITEAKASPFEIPEWKKRLRRDIKKAMELSYDREEFIHIMEVWGYKVKWEPEQKYITYTTPENQVCRDRKLFDETLSRAGMELYFDMGGREYLAERRAWREPGEAEPTLNDAVCGLTSIFEALAVGDNDRFHLETVRHSDQEVKRMLRRGKKIEHGTVVMVDDEDAEYEQYHGFGMMM